MIEHRELKSVKDERRAGNTKERVLSRNDELFLEARVVSRPGKPFAAQGKQKSVATELRKAAGRKTRHYDVGVTEYTVGKEGVTSRAW
jgi:hypothetical protein